MLKRGLAFALALVMLLSVASAVEVPTGDGGTYQVSAWAQKDVAKALELGLLSGLKNGDYRQPIERGNFGMSATKLVALAFGADLDTYWNFVSLRDAMAGKTQTPIYTQLGILQGRGNGDLDQLGTITRQEAAVISWAFYRAVGMVTWTSLGPSPGRRRRSCWRGPIGCILERFMTTRSR